ncbi:putative transporter protein smf2 protein [Phaeoacremonium minimum UCRPA7]|uniref:Putative transporter protein smf2 protein n=1 Tax=Phaeoacremonium minimum (strain UCR-PA7) TaxID=1286976 RepID=R8BK80_PHAM7|nr:putative transporter protein smf2 protein [Phaeoacremonium minimum UCRPA7]EON99758.1 putative transporter protein smf2 protein [Phaeoacremonium minimum UCRPA7]
MNCPSRTDEVPEADGHNQNPNALSNDLTTNQDLNGIANSRVLRGGDSLSIQSAGQAVEADRVPQSVDPHSDEKHQRITNTSAAIGQPPTGGVAAARLKKVIVTFGKFVGPGFMIAVAYIDPGNYATDIAAGASYRFRLLFIVLLSNLFAIFLQSLCIKLGTVTGLNLAEACRAFLPRWLNYVLYAMAEVAIIATDIAEVIGTAIAINLLIPKIPLVAGCALSILDVMVILFFYQPNGAMRGLRAFEFFVVLLVLGVVICFCIQLSMIDDTPVGDVFKGYLPSSAIVERKGLYQACGILGATVMPHSLYLGSGIVQPRLRDYDEKKGLLPPEPRSSASSTHEDTDKAAYMPSLSAIQHSMKYSITELAISLFTFALFVNSAILIVAGASLYQNEEAQSADIFGIHDLLSKSLSPAAGTVFALALLLSGVSAGIVCTIAGQMVSEGALNWSLRPWLRRLVTRSISITPSIIIAGAVGRTGLDAALNGSQVALSVVLPFVTAPLIYFTCLNKYMTVLPGNARLYVPGDPEGNGLRVGIAAAVGSGGGSGATSLQGGVPGSVKMANSIWVAVLAVIIWLIIAAMNVANLVLLGKGD